MNGMPGNGVLRGIMKGEISDGRNLLLLSLPHGSFLNTVSFNAAILIQGNNQGVVGSYGRGHGRNLHVNLAIRQTEVIGSSSNVLYVLEYVESKLNKVDPISRGELGPLNKQITDYIQLPKELALYLHHV